MTTKIEWTDETWNPVTGCTPISPGCANCYARRMARRLAGRYGYPDAPHHFDVTLRTYRLDDPLKWRKARLVFVCSMGDLFHEDVPFEFAVKIWQVMFQAKNHTFQILTKRPERMREFLNLLTDNLDTHPVILPNVWIGVTAENQKTANERIPILLQIPAAVRFLSCEPLLGEICFDSVLTPASTEALRGIQWVIVGAETGPRKRPMQLDWARSIRDQCQAAGVPFFFKKDSDGNHTLDGELYENYPEVK